MLSSLRNFSKSKIAGVFVGIIILPFVFWGMGGMFSSGNTNTIAKINNTNISSQEFIDFLNTSGIPKETLQSNLDKNIIEELLSNLISSTLLDLEIKDYNLIISENTLFKKIKSNKNFLDENGNFQRIKYEKFLLENNQSAPQFEQRLKRRELQKNLFDYIGAGTISPRFLTNKLFEDENRKIEISYIDLNNFYKPKEAFTDKELEDFLNENYDRLKIEYLDFEYALINPKNLMGIDEFNQSFFDKIDQIEVDIANGVKFKNIIQNLDISSIDIKNFKFSSDKTQIEKKIFELRNNKFDIFESGDDYVMYNIKNIEQRVPDLTDSQTKSEIIELISQKNKFDYNKNLLQKINEKKFNIEDFLKMGKNRIKTTQLNSIRDNKKFEIDAVKILYSLPINSFTLINDEQNNIYLAKIDRYKNVSLKENNDELKEYNNKLNSNIKNSMLNTYDLYLNLKYKVDLNQKTIERVKNFFQ